MREKEGVLLWTIHNTYVKGWVKFKNNGIRRIDIDYDTHPHLKKARLTIKPHILVKYIYEQDVFKSIEEN